MYYLTEQDFGVLLNQKMDLLNQNPIRPRLIQVPFRKALAPTSNWKGYTLAKATTYLIITSNRPMGSRLTEFLACLATGQVMRIARTKKVFLRGLVV